MHPSTLSGGARLAVQAGPAVLDSEVFGSLRELLDATILAQTYRDFLSQTRLRLKGFPAASQEKAIREIAHGLRGTAGMLGANRIAAAAARLEEEPVTSRAVEQVIEQLYAECAALESALRKEEL